MNTIDSLVFSVPIPPTTTLFVPSLNPGPHCSRFRFANCSHTRRPRTTPQTFPKCVMDLLSQLQIPNRVDEILRRAAKIRIRICGILEIVWLGVKFKL